MWKYKGDEFVQDYVGTYSSFVYIITHLHTSRKYVGKKCFWSMRKDPGKTRRRKRPSDWLKYWGSSKEFKAFIKQEGKDSFRREILHLCKTKGEASYLEVREQFNRQVLETKLPSGEFEYFNANIMGRYFRKDT